MTTIYGKYFNTKKTPQSEPIPGTAQVKNSAGGYAFAVDDWARLERFLLLGSEGGSYYASERKLTRSNAECVVRCLKEDGPRAVAVIASVSRDGRAPKNSPAIFALALAASLGDGPTKRFAFEALLAVCRTGTHLFEFVAAADGLRGWGRSLREGVASWYTSRSPRDLAYQVTKYQQRNGWSHSDVLRLAHVDADDDGVQAVLRWVRRGPDGLGEQTVSRRRSDGTEVKSTYRALSYPLPGPIEALERAKKATSAAEVVRLIEEYDLVRECVPTAYLQDAAVWEALLRRMPLHAMVRNLGKMTAVGLLGPLTGAAARVADQLADAEAIKKARLHPLALLTALKVYQQGHGEKGKLKWAPVQQVVDALDAAFYLAFQAVEPTGKRWLLALDVSGSMGSPDIAGMPGVSPRVGSAAMALVTANVEKQHHIVGFTAGGGWLGRGVSPLSISPRQRLDDVVRYVSGLPFGGTDCSLPMLYAAERKLEVDAFVVYTDSETWAGNVHPVQALKDYRQKTGIGARLIVVGMTSSEFSIADPNDAGMLDVVGFDTAAPGVMADFVRGG